MTGYFTVTNRDVERNPGAQKKPSHSKRIDNCITVIESEGELKERWSDLPKPHVKILSPGEQACNKNADSFVCLWLFPVFGETVSSKAF